MHCLFKTVQNVRSLSYKHDKVVIFKVNVTGVQLHDIWMTARIVLTVLQLSSYLLSETQFDLHNQCIHGWLREQQDTQRERSVKQPL